MHKYLGQTLRAARESLGLEQVDVARTLGVGQQAVSSWERGTSRPRRNTLGLVATVLELEEDRLVEDGCYAARRTTHDAPVAPRSRTLPIYGLTPEQFEDLTVEIMHELHPKGHASRFGGPGDKQDGIDVLVAGPSGTNMATAQCKRHQQFGEAAVRKAVTAVTVTAPKHYLFLSRPIASPGARKEIGRHPGWALWDGEDISRFIRTLPADRGVRLVDIYFPGHREPFLGVPSPGPWLVPEDYFSQSPAQLFNHDWQLVGRDEQLRTLTQALYHQTGNLATLEGPGGIGKTRLLKAIAEASPDAATRIFVLVEKTPVDARDYELLPSRGCVVVMIDDAHDRDDLTGVVAGIWRRNAASNILLATRPYRWAGIRSDLQRAGFLADNHTKVQISDLQLIHAEELARQALGEHANLAVVQRLARLTVDCPLVTVVGGGLIRRGELDPSQLGQDDQVRNVIFERFRHALISDPLVADPDTRSAVLDAVSALQPVRTDDENFREALAGVTGKPFDVLAKHLKSLEGTGVIRRRGTSVRIVPDMLGDIVLAQACVDSDDGQPTGYLDRLLTSVKGAAMDHLFVNVCRVDWQVKQRGRGTDSLIKGLWSRFEADLETTDIPHRQTAVHRLTNIAQFQPARVVAIARWLIDHPTDNKGDESTQWSYLGVPSYDDVLTALAPMIKGAAYTLKTLPDALNLLWELAQKIHWSVNQNSNHPLRVLRELATFEPNKPVAYNEAIVKASARWFDTVDELSPFEVLPPILATEGHSRSYRNYTLTFQPFALEAEVVGPIRQSAVNIAFEEAQHPDVRRAVAAVEFIEKSLRYPTGAFGREVTADERERWTVGFVRTIEQLGAIADESTLDPVVLVSIRKALIWHASHSNSGTRVAARKVLSSLRDELPDRLALIIHDSWGRLMFDRTHDYEQMQTEVKRRLDSAVGELSAAPDGVIIAALQNRLEMELRAFGPDKAHPGQLIGDLVRARPSLASALLDLMAHEPSSVLTSAMPDVLSALAQLDPTAAISRMGRLLGLQSSSITLDVARALGWNRDRRQLAPGESELLFALATDADPSVRHAVITAVQRLRDVHPDTAVRLLATIDFSDSPDLADDLFMCFAAPFSLHWEMFTTSEADAMRAQLVKLNDIGGHWITEFLADRSYIDAEWVIALIQSRVASGESMDSLGDYRPMPNSFDATLRVRDTVEFDTYLRHLYAWIAAAPESSVRREFGAELFKEVAGDYDQFVLDVLHDALKTTRADDVAAVAAILSKAPRTLIWDHHDFVREAINAATQVGKEYRDEIVSALRGATMFGSRSGTAGEPFAEDIEQRDRSLEAAAKMPTGSHAEKFYQDIASSGQRDIDKTSDEANEHDGRVW